MRGEWLGENGVHVLDFLMTDGEDSRGRSMPSELYIPVGLRIRLWCVQQGRERARGKPGATP